MLENKAKEKKLLQNKKEMENSIKIEKSKNKRRDFSLIQKKKLTCQAPDIVYLVFCGLKKCAKEKKDVSLKKKKKN